MKRIAQIFPSVLSAKELLGNENGELDEITLQSVLSEISFNKIVQDSKNNKSVINFAEEISTLKDALDERNGLISSIGITPFIIILYKI